MTRLSHGLRWPEEGMHIIGLGQCIQKAHLVGKATTTIFAASLVHNRAPTHRFVGAHVSIEAFCQVVRSQKG